MNIAAVLREGDPRGLGHTQEAIDFVLAHRDKLDELFACLFNDNVYIRMRAGDALEKICRQHPDWLQPYIGRLFREVAAIDQPSVQWHLVQMIGQLQLTPSQKQRAIEILKHNFEHVTDWIVLNFTIEVFAQFVAEQPALRDYYVQQLHKLQNDPHKSVGRRATKYLASLQ